MMTTAHHENDLAGEKKSFFGAKRLYGIIKKSHVVSDVWVPAGTGPL